jgi:cytochrome c
MTIRIFACLVVCVVLAAEVQGGARGTPAEAKAMLAKAAAHYKAVGRKQALADFTGKKAPFADRDLYVFCIGPDRLMVANGGFPSFVGMSVDVLKDANGKPLGSALWEAGSRAGGGAVEYPHINPVSHKPEPKVSFVEKMGDDVCGVGAYKGGVGNRMQLTRSKRREGADVPRDAPGRAIIAAWRTNNRATTYLVEQLPPVVWSVQVPGISGLTVGMIAAHLHNSRCSWIRSIGARHGVKVPPLVDLRGVRPRQLLLALSRSSKGMIDLIELGIARGGRVPRATWQNFPTDLEHFLSYFAAHEGHHRGQLVMLARQLGHRLPRTVAGGIWQWTKFAREQRDALTSG